MPKMNRKEETKMVKKQNPTALLRDLHGAFSDVLVALAEDYDALCADLEDVKAYYEQVKEATTGIKEVAFPTLRLAPSRFSGTEMALTEHYKVAIERLSPLLSAFPSAGEE